MPSIETNPRLKRDPLARLCTRGLRIANAVVVEVETSLVVEMPDDTGRLEAKLR